MIRFLFCGLQMLLVLAFVLPGCARNRTTLRAPECPEDIAGLPVGSAAPEIEGEDIDGARFKLSDYKGQVVLLDFWGNW
jgi:cytochrome oxidase Cu insertion factor (SCO1/SenC/PrrC family)